MNFEDIDRKTLILFGVIYIIVIIIILVVIWYPKDKSPNSNINDIFSYSDYTEDQTYNKYALIYANDISLDLVLQNYRALYEKADSVFIANNKLNIDNFNAYLKNNGYYGNGITSDRYEVIKIGDTVIYPLRLKINNETKDVNVIEKSPYDYSLSFGNDYSSVMSNEENKIYKDYTVSGINFIIESVRNTRQEISLDITVKNAENNKVNINLEKYGNVKIIAGNDNKEYDKSVEVDVTNIDTLNAGSYMSTTIDFKVPVSEQIKVKSVVFVGVKINDGEAINIEVPIK